MKQMVRKTTRPLKRSFSTEFYLRARQEIGLNQYYYVVYCIFFGWIIHNIVNPPRLPLYLQWIYGSEFVVPQSVVSQTHAPHWHRQKLNEWVEIMKAIVKRSGLLETNNTGRKFEIEKKKKKTIIEGKHQRRAGQRGLPLIDPVSAHLMIRERN